MEGPGTSRFQESGTGNRGGGGVGVASPHPKDDHTAVDRGPLEAGVDVPTCTRLVSEGLGDTPLDPSALPDTVG